MLQKPPPDLGATPRFELQRATSASTTKRRTRRPAAPATAFRARHAAGRPPPPPGSAAQASRLELWRRRPRADHLGHHPRETDGPRARGSLDHPAARREVGREPLRPAPADLARREPVRERPERGRRGRERRVAVAPAATTKNGNAGAMKVGYQLHQSLARIFDAPAEHDPAKMFMVSSSKRDLRL